MRIAIVEDREQDRQELISMLKTHFHNKGLAGTWDCYTSGLRFLTTFSPGQYDLIFLDIYMSELNGMETARQIRQTDTSCSLIFFTTSYAHAVESYEVNASYYLTKPLKETALARALDIVCTPLEKDNQYITLIVKGNIKTEILLKDIMYVDCISRRTYIHLPEKQLIVYDPIASVLDSLSRDPRFLSCNRNVMVNMDWIESVPSDEFLLKNQERVPIRQRGRKTVKKTFLEYTLKGLRREETL